VQADELLDTIYRVMRAQWEYVQNSNSAERVGQNAGLSAATRLNILVVEDTEFNAQVLEMFLTRMGHEVTLAYDGNEALRVVQSGGFDLLLLDVHMPGHDGIEVARRIREREAGSGEHLPIVAITARSRPEDREECLASGMDEYLTKPFRVADLRAAITRLNLRGTVVPKDDPQGEACFSVLDAGVLLTACGRSQAMLETLTVSFRQHVPHILTQLGDEIAAGDLHRVRDAAHKLAGILCGFSLGATAVVVNLEQLASAAHNQDLSPTFDQLKELCDQLLTELDFVSITALTSKRSDA